MCIDASAELGGLGVEVWAVTCEVGGLLGSTFKASRVSWPRFRPRVSVTRPSHVSKHGTRPVGRVMVAVIVVNGGRAGGGPPALRSGKETGPQLLLLPLLLPPGCATSGGGEKTEQPTGIEPRDREAVMNLMEWMWL